MTADEPVEGRDDEFSIYAVTVNTLIHRTLAHHGLTDVCDECPCFHCGSSKSDPDGDHSCPCPYSDAECIDHWSPSWAARKEGHD